MNRHETPVITVKEARRLLGAGSKRMSDDQVLAVIAALTSIAKQHIKKSGSKKAAGVI